MPMLVLDATPLIYLAKAGQATLLGELPGDLVVPATVHEEVVGKGEARGETDAARIRKLVEDGTLRILEAPTTALAERLAENPRLHAAEREVLVLAQAHGGRAILDERHGRSIAEVEGVDHGGTIYLLLRLLEEQAITPEAARDTVDTMIEQGWYCSTDLYAKIVRRLASF